MVGVAGAESRHRFTCEAAGYAESLVMSACPWRRVASGEPPVLPLGGSLCHPVGDMERRAVQRVCVNPEPKSHPVPCKETRSE